MRKILPFAVVLLLMAVSVLAACSSDPSDADRQTYSTLDSTYTYSTHGAGTDSSPYYSIIYSVESTADTLFLQSAVEGYELTTISSMGGCGSDTLVIPRTVTVISDSAFDFFGNLKRIVFLGDRPEGKFPAGVSILALQGSSGWDPSDGVETMKVSQSTGGARYFVLDGKAVVIGGTGPRISIPSADPEGNPFTTVASESFRESDVESVAFGDSIEDIGTRAFYNCIKLSSVSLPPSLVKVGDEAFRYCISLGDVDLHKVREIGFESFRDCRSFSSIVIPDTLETLGGGAFYLCRGAVSIDIGSLTELPERTFGYCTSLESVDLSDVRSIGLSAFNTCRSLEKVVLGSVEDIGMYAFYGCMSLGGMDFGPHLLSVDDEAFSECLSIVDIRFPDTLQRMGKNVFFHANNLEDIYFEGRMPSMPDDPFPGLPDLKVHINGDNAQSWSSYDGNLIIEGGSSDRSDYTLIIAAVAVVVLASASFLVLRRRSR